jgi:zinc and cadmium transporter
MLTSILIASFIGSILGLAGGVLLLWRESLAHRFSLSLIALATGTLLAASLFDLLPEALAEGSARGIMVALFFGILSMVFFERITHALHADSSLHEEEPHDHTKDRAVVWNVMAGDSLHNFLDGFAIAVGFLGGSGLGVVTTIATLLHELPQEIGDFSIMLHAGYSRRAIIGYNLLSACMTFLGAFLGYLGGASFAFLVPYALAFTAGIFLYIALSDLVPSVVHHEHVRWYHLLFILIGAALIFGAGILGGE